ncbi:MULTISPECIES: bifunctional transcriptional activator/DNA repair enzyme AdaA [unclassified Spirosoma]|uniref:bifunctional transcriptional activator/DNA repair enzyme AdaA n=1 Tax=unclassified Spirosoma TaxID=2621999 RepID=UPI0009617437|nr:MULTISPECIES: methylated-DNA--[protein]-cysteine S-methyltransferase [unclassified Spirosoma]MBN8823541.1 methylated-DNA--[protein]-cysteine S-methyltransferase [Spirosoma sp.]OJW71854.1 MAG: 6-O-methylguanine DNA methyltransferase [Spirosoma sp. 48-14]
MTTNSTYTYQQIAQAIEHLTATFREQPSLSELATKANMSEFHFQRLFTEWAGVSPKKFSQYLTLEHAKTQLRKGVALSEAAYEAGLSGTGRLHDLFVTIEGVTPGQFKQAGSGLQLVYGVFDSPFGAYVLGTMHDKIALLHFLDDQDDPVTILKAAWPEASLIHDPTSIQRFTNQIFPVTGEPNQTISTPLPVLMRGSAFQLKVWEALLKIPEGQLASYDQIADAIGQPTASRAVGTAIGANPIGYLIPCHRVIKKTGLFGGYRWGAERKQAMLGWEAARVDN